MWRRRIPRYYSKPALPYQPYLNQAQSQVFWQVPACVIVLLICNLGTVLHCTYFRRRLWQWWWIHGHKSSLLFWFLNLWPPMLQHTWATKFKSSQQSTHIIILEVVCDPPPSKIIVCLPESLSISRNSLIELSYLFMFFICFVFFLYLNCYYDIYV